VVRAPLSRWVVGLALVELAVLLVTASRYGYHRDELYFVVSGRHPAWGYPDQPALVPLVAAGMNALARGDLFVLRLPSALASVAVTLVAGLLSREIGGSRRAQVVATACTAVSGFALAVGHFVTTTTFDMLSTTLLLALAIRAVVRRRELDLLLAGVVLGIGAEAKPQVVVVAVVMVIALAVRGPRWVLRSRWFYAGLAIAIVLAAPYLLWQARHGFPQITVAGNVAGSAEGGRIGFIPFQLVLVSPVLVPVWLAGLVAPLRGRTPVMRLLGFVPVTYLVVGLVYLLGDGKAYYLASLYPVVLAIGSLPTDHWLDRGRRRLRAGLLSVGVIVSALISGLIALPLLPETQLQGGVSMAVDPDVGETVGWPAYLAELSHAWASIPPSVRAHTALFTGNYGEAGAVEVLGGSYPLPHAYSAHNAFALWSRPPDTDTHALVVGYDGPADASPYFTGCRILARVDNHVGLDNDEQHGPIMLCRVTRSWTRMWPQLVHYN
jgi:Dolichyl-phosphate-mannose-protein mannosyltransferase